MDNNSELNNNTAPEVGNTQGMPTVVDPTAVATNTNSVENVQEQPTVADPTAVATNTNPVENVQEQPTVTDSTAVNVNSEQTGNLTPTVNVEPQTSETKEEPAFENRMVNPGVIGNISPTKESDELVNENLKKVEINYTPPSKGKTILLIFFFVFLIAFIIFLPEITTMVNKLKSNNEEYSNEKITDGKLVCTYSTNTTNLDKDYKLVFSFTNNQLDKLDYKITTKGDPTSDSDTLDNLSENCNKLNEYTESVNGINVTCDYSEGQLVERQIFTYSDLDEEELSSAYSEQIHNIVQNRIWI